MTLKELAKQLGLSPTTVSRALNGFPEVSEDTRKKVAAAAKTYGYRPNNRARSLATGRTYTIGHVIPMTSEHEMVNPVFSDFVAGAGEVYAAKGFDMLISVVPDSDQEAAYRDLKTRGAVDGIIVHAPKKGEKRLQMLRDVGIPFVVHGRASDMPEDYNWVDMDNTHAFQRATDLLLDLGHREIALINGLEDMDFAIRRRHGFEQALGARGVALRDAYCHSGEMTEHYGYEAGRALLALSTPPTALLVSSMIPAIGLRRAIREAGLELGRDISVIIHDDDLSYLSNAVGNATPQFTATRSSVREAGRQAASMLVDVIETSDPNPRNVLLEAQLILGASTGPARSA